jgi:hypothetical protein
LSSSTRIANNEPRGIVYSSHPMVHRRTLLALAISLAVHAGLVAGFAGIAVFRGWQAARTVDFELVSTSIKEVEALPLGPPPPAAAEARKQAAGRRARARSADEGVKIPVADAGSDGGGAADAGDGGAARDASPEVAHDGGAPADGRDGGLRRPNDGRLAGPPGSRVQALLRLDRLRAAPESGPTIAAVDGLLRRLPDRRRLLDGTGLDLFRDFDSLFIATPNPMDDTVTFLVVRHHLTDAAFMAAMSRGAEAAGRPITWRDEGGRPVGLRAARRIEADAGVLPRSVLRDSRDDRIFVLPEAGMAVMAPPAYATLLLGSARAAADGGVAAKAVASERRWRQLAAQIAAEAAAMPDDAILTMSAANMVSARGKAGGGTVPLAGPNGLPLPKFVTMNTGVTPSPFLELSGTFEHASDAAAYAAAWPGWKQTLLGSPLLLLSGFSSIVARAELSQDDNAVVVRTTGSNEELRRLLATIANLLGPGGR